MNTYIIKSAIETFFRAIELLIIARILLSLIIRDPYNPIIKFLYDVTEPILSPFRRLFDILGIRTGMFDFSPLLAFYTLDIISRLITRLIP